MSDLDREVQEALEADGYQVESVESTLGESGPLQRSAYDPLATNVLWLALKIAGKVGDELVGDTIRAALSKAKEIVLRKRQEGDRHALETKNVGLWLPDGSGGWYLADYERIDE